MSSGLFLHDRNPIRSDISGVGIVRGAFCNPQRSFQVCATCVMDTTDPEIVFDNQGICSYCKKVTAHFSGFEPADSGQIPSSVAAIRKPRSGSDYDCIIGLSGGIDSSFLLVKAVEWGLRPLVVHIDAGWNSEVAVGNIYRLVEKLDLDLHTEVIDWDAVRRAQIAFLRSGVANLDTPQDHVFITGLMHIAISEGISAILTGSNMATESILPPQWGYDSKDGRHIESILRRFGHGEFSSFPSLTAYEFRFGLNEKYGIHFVDPLNEIAYSRDAAVSELSKRFAWEDYGGKHYESVWTKYFQGHLLPYRFGYDKRKAHLSSRILNGELSREQALVELQRPLYDSHSLKLDEVFVASKLELDREELVQLKDIKLSHFSDYPNDARKMWRVSFYKRRLNQVRGLFGKLFRPK